MLFSSISFLYFFLAATLVLYYALPKKWRNGVLLVASLLFYFFGERKYTVLLLLSSVINYISALIIEKHRGTKKAKVTLIISVIVNLLILGVFKYTDFLIGTVNGLFDLSIPLTHLPLPIGISFFTFQTMSYTIDVYRGTAHVQRNIISFATFVCLFPQLVAGPIVRYSDIESEIDPLVRTTSVDQFGAGAARFIIGLGKKVLLANKLGELHTALMAGSQLSVVSSWVAAASFALQIYFDFSGYSDMAIGLGHMFGFTFPENFAYPFMSKTITEFWRRWHMTLGGWFRDYVYIPLGGNRVKTYRYILNIFIVWGLTGLWHGASWNFVLWGLFFGVFLALEKMFLYKPLSKKPVLGWFYTQFLVLISFVIFSNETVSGIFTQLKGMFFAGGLPIINTETVYYLRSYAVIFVLALIGCTSFPAKAAKKLNEKLPAVSLVAEPLGLAALLLLCTAFLVDSSYNPFLYFRF